MSSSPRKASHGRVPLICAAVVVLMTGASFAAVPLYKAFCQATGFGGSIPRAAKAPGHTLDQTVTIYFDTNVRGLPWTFHAAQRSQKVKVGASNVAYFEVVNNSDHALTGRAIYSVTPGSAGWHVRKLQCFCFNAETLQPHQHVKWPVIYFIDPKFASDPEMKGYGDLTLSYIFVPDPQEAPTALHPAA
ncbi:MAG TPA: cytochrome c oxidase assembly protein [Caulobacteraceae bacterium]